MSILIEGWLAKDGGALGSAKMRYCVLSVNNERNLFTFAYYIDDLKRERKGCFELARDCDYTKTGPTKFTVVMTNSTSSARRSGSVVEFDALTVEAFESWEKLFIAAKNPIRSLLVIGALGSIGMATVHKLSELQGTDFTIHAGVRDLAGATAATSNCKDLKSCSGVSIVHTDVSLPDTITAACSNMNCIFFVSDSCDIMSPDNIRVDLIIAAIQACQASSAIVDVGATSTHIVVLSTNSVAAPEMTLATQQMLHVEEYVKTSGLTYTIVRVPLLMENIIGQLKSICLRGEIHSPILPTAMYNAASVNDVGECLAKIMTNSNQYVNKTITLTGPLCSENTYADACSLALNHVVTVKHVQIPMSITKEHALSLGMPEWYIAKREAWIELYQLINSSHPSYTSHSPEMRDILGRDLCLPSALPTLKFLPLYRDEWLKRESKLAEPDRLVMKEVDRDRLVMEEVEKALKAAEAQIKAEKKAKLVAAKADYDAFMRSFPSTITEGSIQQKKLESETSFKKRFIWIDYEKKTFCWAKVANNKKALYKSRSLSDKDSPTVIEFDEQMMMISIKSAGKTSIDIKVDDNFAWTSALKKCCIDDRIEVFPKKG